MDGVCLVFLKKSVFLSKDLGVDDVKDVSYRSGLLMNIDSDFAVMSLDLELLSTSVFVIISFNFCKASLFLSSLIALKGSKESCFALIFFMNSRDFSVEAGKC